MLARCGFCEQNCGLTLLANRVLVIHIAYDKGDCVTGVARVDYICLVSFAPDDFVYEIYYAY